MNKIINSNLLSNTSIISLLKKLWNHMSKRRKKQFILLFLLMLLSAATEVVSLGMILPFLGVLTNPDQIFSYSLVNEFALKFRITEPNELLLPITLIFIFISIFSGFVRFILLWSSTRLSNATAVDLSVDIFKKTLYQSYEIHISRNSSEILSGITLKTGSVVSFILFQCLTIITAFIVISSIIAVIFIINPLATTGALVGLALCYGTISILIAKKLKKNGRYIAEEQTNVIKSIQEGLGAIRDILINGTQQIYVKLYYKSESKLRHSMGSNNIIGGSPRFFIEMVAIIIFVILSYILSNTPGGIAQFIPLLGALALGTQKVLPMLQQAYSSWAKMTGNTPLLRDAMKLLDQPLSYSEDKVINVSLPFNHEIRLDNISFNYNKSSKKILENISFTIKKGSKIGLIGSTGSGKTTLVDCIMGLLQPDFGKIYVDDTLIDSNNKKSWQLNIAHVPQNIYLADSNIMENIAFGIKPSEIDLNKVDKAAEKAQIKDFILELANGYNTAVGERGVRLSGGQCQRIGIARALYKNSSLLILDEATSALDVKKENALMETINNFDKNLTMIIIAHRYSTLKKCDIIFEIDKGKIVQEGSYQKLFGEDKD